MLPEKQYFTIAELAQAWQCGAVDILHYIAHGHLQSGVRVWETLMYGIDSNLRTVGVYIVTGVLNLQPACAAEWELDPHIEITRYGFAVNPGYPPDISDASYVAEDSVTPSYFRWASGRSWNDPEVDFSRIERFTTPPDSGIQLRPEAIVIHRMERQRFESVHELQEAPDQERVAASYDERLHQSTTESSELASNTCDGGSPAGSANSLLGTKAGVNGEYRLVQKGDFWEVIFDGSSCVLKNSKGMLYVAYLMERPGTDVFVRDLYYAVNPPDSSLIDSNLSAMTEAELLEEGLALESDDVKEDYKLHALRAKQKQLDDQIEDAHEFGDEDLVLKLQTQRDGINRYLKSCLGLGGRERKANSKIERMRSNITKRINALKAEAKKASPELARHLMTIKTGAFCRYEPASPIKSVIERTEKPKKATS